MRYAERKLREAQQWYGLSEACSTGPEYSPASDVRGPAPFSLRFGQKRKPKRRTDLTRVRACASLSPLRREADYFAAAAFCAAHRFLTASAIRFRPSGDRFLFFFAGFVAAGTTAADAFLGTATTFFGRPTVFFGAGAAPPLSRARACCSFAISLSIVARTSEIAM